MDLVGAGRMALLQRTQKFNPIVHKNYWAFVKPYVMSYVEKEFYSNTCYSRIEGKKLVKNYVKTRRERAAKCQQTPELNLRPIVYLSEIAKDNGDDEPLAYEDIISGKSDFEEMINCAEVDKLLQYLQTKGNGKGLLWRNIIETVGGVGRRRWQEPLILAAVKKQLKFSNSKESLRQLRERLLAILRKRMEQDKF